MKTKGTIKNFNTLRSPISPAVRRDGYSLVEVLMAGAIVVTAVAAASVTLNSLVRIESTNAKLKYALNLQEQAARLWQMGVATNSVTNILPTQFSSNASSVTEHAMWMSFAVVTDTNYGLEMATHTVVFWTGTNTGSSNKVTRTNVITVVRPTLR